MADLYYARSADVASRVVGGEAVLVKLPEGVLYVLSPSASRIWVHADGLHTASELAEGLDPAVAAGFFGRMTELGLLERAAAPRAKADAHPQGTDLPMSPDPPEVLAGEPVETILAGSAGPIDISCIERMSSPD